MAKGILSDVVVEAITPCTLVGWAFYDSSVLKKGYFRILSQGTVPTEYQIATLNYNPLCGIRDTRFDLSSSKKVVNESYGDDKSYSVPSERIVSYQRP